MANAVWCDVTPRTKHSESHVLALRVASSTRVRLLRDGLHHKFFYDREKIGQLKTNMNDEDAGKAPDETILSSTDQGS